ncbi:hypothetical protein [Roseovarius sp. A-2]|uniref:hypothetical protein n=1 Tax=Roseovarius sp. A-2 TaxID=1570360 RepID=UPI00111943D1|nr:hypothetical protein [Roseovarius sp. A-2]
MAATLVPQPTSKNLQRAVFRCGLIKWQLYLKNLTFDIDDQEKRMLFIDLSAEGLDQPFAASGFCGQ